MHPQIYLLAYLDWIRKQSSWTNLFASLFVNLFMPPPECRKLLCKSCTNSCVSKGPQTDLEGTQVLLLIPHGVQPFVVQAIVYLWYYSPRAVVSGYLSLCVYEFFTRPAAGRFSSFGIMRCHVSRGDNNSPSAQRGMARLFFFLNTSIFQAIWQ